MTSPSYARQSKWPGRQRGGRLGELGLGITRPPRPADLVVSGGVVDDAVRVAAVEGDGLAPESTFLIDRDYTNLVTNGGFETDLTDMTSGGASYTYARVAPSWPLFGGYCRRATYSSGTDNNIGNLAPAGLAASTTYCLSAYVRYPSSFSGTGTIQGLTRGGDWSDGTTDATILPDLSLKDEWQRTWIVFTTGTDLTGTITFRISTTSNAGVEAGDFIDIDGVMLHPGKFPHAYLETDGATASATDGRVYLRNTAAANEGIELIDPSQFWVCFRTRCVWADADRPEEFPLFLNWQNDSTNLVQLLRDATNRLVWRRRAGSAGDPSVTYTWATPWARGADYTIIATATPAELRLASEGAAFATVANDKIPHIADTIALDIANGSGNFQFGWPIYWWAMGAGTITEEARVAFFEFGNADPGPAAFDIGPAIPTFYWSADTAAYEKRFRPPPYHRYVKPAGFPADSLLAAWQLNEAGRDDLELLYYHRPSCRLSRRDATRFVNKEEVTINTDTNLRFNSADWDTHGMSGLPHDQIGTPPILAADFEIVDRIVIPEDGTYWVEAYSPPFGGGASANGSILHVDKLGADGTTTRIATSGGGWNADSAAAVQPAAARTLHPCRAGDELVMIVRYGAGSSPQTSSTAGTGTYSGIHFSAVWVAAYPTPTLPWTAPKTWTTNETLTEADGNAQIRDNVHFLANPPRCLVYMTADETVLTLVEETLDFGAELFDTDKMHDDSTNPSRITCRTAGKYLIYAHVLWEGDNQGDSMMRLRLNGGSTYVGMTEGEIGANTFDWGMAITTVVPLAVNDYLELRVERRLGSQDVQGGSIAETYIGALWLMA